MKPIHILLLILVAAGAVLAANSAFVVRETDQAMVLALGRVERTIAEPGLHFKVPFYQQLLYFDRRVLEADAPQQEVPTQDKKRIVIDSFTRWRIADAKLFFESLRTMAGAQTQLNRIVNSNILQVVGQNTLLDLVSGDRAAIVEAIRAAAAEQAEPFGIEIIDIRIKRTDLPDANQRAVFERMRTEREAEARDIRARGAEQAQIIRAEAEKERTILLAEANRDAQKLRGDGDAEAIRITAAAYGQDPEFFKFQRSLQAYREGLVSGNAETLLLLDPSVGFFDTLNGN